MISTPNMFAMLKDMIANNVLILAHSTTPTDGTSGTGVGIAGPGTLLVDYTNAAWYYNNNTAASPTWVAFSLEDVTGDVTISDGVSTIGAGNVTSAKLAASLLRTATGTISSANITGTSSGQLGHANGVELVAAGGANVVNELVSCILINDYSTAAYTGGGNTTINIGSGGAALTGLASNAQFIQLGADGIVEFQPLAAAYKALTANVGINLVTASAPTQPGTAAGVFRYIVTYRQHATGL